MSSEPVLLKLKNSIRFDGKVRTRGECLDVHHFVFVADNGDRHVPVRARQQLNFAAYCQWQIGAGAKLSSDLFARREGNVADPLFNCLGTQVSDLSPLKECADTLICQDNR